MVRHLDALAQNGMAIAYAMRRFCDGVKCRIIVTELREQFDIRINYPALRNLLYRRSDYRKSKESVLDSNTLDKLIEQDARAGFSIHEIAKRHNVSVRRIYRAVRLGDYISERDDQLRRALQDRQRRPKWMDRAADESIDGPLTSAGKVFAELGDHECRYSIGRDADGALRFCGEARAMDGRLLRRPYCEKHGDLAVASEGSEIKIDDWMLDGYAPGNRRPS